MKIKAKINKIIANVANSVSQNSVKTRATERSTAEMSALCREAASEGIVMLKNKNNVLPITNDRVVSIFGRVQKDFFFVGYGSGGDVNAPYKINLVDGIKNCEKIQINEELESIYDSWRNENPVDDGWWGHWPMCYDEMPVSKELAKKAKEKSDTAVVVIGRSAGEDRESTLEKGSYYLTDTEHEMIENVCAEFDKVVVLLNCGSIMDMSALNEFGDKISSILYIWQCGMESGNAIADILCGNVSPSGKMTTTIAKSFESYPSSANFGNKDFNNYREDIFLDYRFFETFNKDAVIYPFGFGLSYADFEIKTTRLIRRDDSFNLLVNVKNVSEKFSGKEVVQVYVKAPQGTLGKEEKRLVAFAKTSLLAPGEEEKVRISFSEYDFASYDDSGVSSFPQSYIIENGEYEIHVGNSVRNAQKAKTFFVAKTKVLATHLRICSPQKKFERLIAKTVDGKIKAMTFPVPTLKYNLQKRILENLPKDIPQTDDIGLKFDDVKNGKCSLDDFVARLSFDELEAISRGDYEMNSPLGAPGNAGAFAGVLQSLRDKGIPAVITTDGPSGIRLSAGCSLLPNGVCLASTFNTELVEQLYTELGKEMKDRGTDVLLGPGMNIHRNPLCGRNFEYLSADPFLSGTIAAAIVNGIRKNGVSACPKHYACNNREVNRTKNSSNVSERALREIYLKGFEIMVKRSNPQNIMTSYNKINGVWSHYNYDLCTVVLRNEWNFTGCVMTDWWMQSSESPEFKGVFDRGYRVRSGVNVLMPGAKRVHNGKPDGSAKKSMKAKNGLTIGELRQNAKHVLTWLLEK